MIINSYRKIMESISNSDIHSMLYTVIRQFEIADLHNYTTHFTTKYVT
jgi:hypothetical protein